MAGIQMDLLILFKILLKYFCLNSTFDPHPNSYCLAKKLQLFSFYATGTENYLNSVVNYFNQLLTVLSHSLFIFMTCRGPYSSFGTFTRDISHLHTLWFTVSHKMMAFLCIHCVWMTFECWIFSMLCQHNINPTLMFSYEKLLTW